MSFHVSRCVAVAFWPERGERPGPSMWRLPPDLQRGGHGAGRPSVSAAGPAQRHTRTATTIPVARATWWTPLVGGSGTPALESAATGVLDERTAFRGPHGNYRSYSSLIPGWLALVTSSMTAKSRDARPVTERRQLGRRASLARRDDRR